MSDEQPMEPVDLRGQAITAANPADITFAPEVARGDPVARILELVDARIHEQINLFVTDYVQGQLQALWGAIAELQAGELGDSYRNYIISEAKRLGVRPGEVAGGARRAD